MEIGAKKFYSDDVLLRGFYFSRESFMWHEFAAMGIVLLTVIRMMGSMPIGAILAAFGYFILRFGIWPMWAEKRAKGALLLHPWRNREIQFRFTVSSFQVVAPNGDQSIDYRAIKRVSFDDRGLVVFGNSFTPIWIPGDAFMSEKDRMGAYNLIRASFGKSANHTAEPSSPSRAGLP